MRSPLRPGSLSGARAGVSLMFFTNGVLFTALLPRYPQLKDAFALSNGQFGLMVIAFPIGGVLAAGHAGRVIRRFGALSANSYGSCAFAASFVLAGSSHAVWMFALGLLMAGACDAVVDAAQNVQGVTVERVWGRSIMNSFHAVWSVGAAAGGAIGTCALALHISPGLEMLINGAAWSFVAVLARRLAEVPGSSVPRPVAQSSPEADARDHVWRLMVPLVLLAVCGSVIEDVANNWAVLYLGHIVGAPTVIAGLTLTAVLVSQFVGRVLGDPMTVRWGRGPVASAGAALVTVGALLIASAPAYPLAFFGFALTGFGNATLVPAAFAGAGRVRGLQHGTGIAIVGWLMRLGFLITSPLIGWLSELTNLRTAMLIPAAAGVLAGVLGRRIAGRTSQSR